MIGVILGILLVQTLFVGIGGAYMLYQQGRLAHLRSVNTIETRRRRARKVDQFALCRINRLTQHHQHHFHAEMRRETKPEMTRASGNLTEVYPRHDPAMLALVKLVNAKLVTQTAGLETLFGVKAGDNVSYKRKVEEFRAARAYLNLHGDQPPVPVTRSDTEQRIANAA